MQDGPIGGGSGRGLRGIPLLPQGPGQGGVPQGDSQEAKGPQQVLNNN